MRLMSGSRQFVLLLAITFCLVIAFSINLIYEFRRYSIEGAKLTQNLQSTFALNQELRLGIENQIKLLHAQLEQLDPDFRNKLNNLNYDLDAKQARYLTLDIGQDERYSVEKIRNLQAELGVQGSLIYELSYIGKRAESVERFREADEIRKKLDVEFGTLNTLQVRKLKDVLEQSNRSLRDSYTSFYAFIGSLLIALIAFAYLLRRQVLRPLNSILEASDKIRQGNFAARAKINRTDEIGKLAQGFNFMAESLSESYGNLERKVEERTLQLQELQQQLVQAAKLSAMGRLVGGVAHELNNPLTVILGYTELARSRLREQGADAADLKFIDELYFQGDRCRRIVANLLQFARQGQPHLEVVRVNEVIERMLQLREYELRTKNIELIRNYDPANPELSADPHKLQQVVLNLLNNAYDAIQEAGNAGTIWVSTRTFDGKVTIEFRDNGTGVQEPERVFDPFYTTKPTGQGTGLGLSVCYGIVEEHNGEIRADNWDKGARFVITLPTGNTNDLRRAAEKPLELRAGKQNLKAMVVDDEETIISLQLEFLGALGFKGFGFSSGEEALRFLKTNSVDVVISDVRMPGSVDGIQLYNWIRDNRPELAKRFLFVSGDLVGMNTGRFFTESSAARIQKPFKFESYSRIITQLLEN